MSKSSCYKEGYKVVTELNDRYFSATKCTDEQFDIRVDCKILTQPGVEYFEDEWTYPKKGFGSLLLFNNLKNAKSFVDYVLETGRFNGHYHIYTCLYVPTYRMPRIKGFKHTPNLRKFLPKGTITASAIMLQDKVYERIIE